jgi:hypothetical protein
MRARTACNGSSAARFQNVSPRLSYPRMIASRTMHSHHHRQSRFSLQYRKRRDKPLPHRSPLDINLPLTLHRQYGEECTSGVRPRGRLSTNVRSFSINQSPMLLHPASCMQNPTPASTLPTPKYVSKQSVNQSYSFDRRRPVLRTPTPLS